MKFAPISLIIRISSRTTSSGIAAAYARMVLMPMRPAQQHALAIQLERPMLDELELAHAEALASRATRAVSSQR